jgi:hypothetical protein
MVMVSLPFSKNQPKQSCQKMMNFLSFKIHVIPNGSHLSHQGQENLLPDAAIFVSENKNSQW